MRRDARVEPIYLTVRHEVVAGTLQPGDEIATTATMERFAVSRSCALEALRWLCEDGYLERKLPFNFRVRSYTAREVYYRFTTLIALETQVAASVACMATKSHVRCLREVSALIGTAARAAPPDIDTFVQRSRELRELQLEIVQNTPLADAVASAAQPAVFRLTAAVLPDTHFPIAHSTIEQLLDAYAHRDPCWARAMVQAAYFPILYCYLDHLEEVGDRSAPGIFAKLARRAPARPLEPGTADLEHSTMAGHQPSRIHARRSR